MLTYSHMDKIFTKLKSFTSQHKIILIPIACAIIYMLLCITNIFGSVWFDEAYSGLIARFNFAKIWQLTSVDVHPPLYYFILKIWSDIFGSTDYTMRFLSVFFGAISIIVAFFMLKKMFNNKVATIGAAFMALNPFLIRYGQEMRMYTMVVFLVILATYILQLALTSKKRSYWLAYGVVVSLGMWTQYYSVFAWLAHFTFLIFHFRAKIFQKNVVYAYLLAILVFLPWLPFAVKQIASVQKGFWIPPVSAVTFPDFISQSLIYHDFSSLPAFVILPFWLFLSVAICLIVKYFKSAKSEQKTSFTLLLFLSTLPVILSFILSLPPMKPTFYNRYLIFSSVTLSLLLAVAIFYYYQKKSINFSQKLLVLPVFAALIFGTISVLHRYPESHVKASITSLQSQESSDVPILADNNLTFYQAVFYENSKQRVNLIKDWPKINFPPEEPVQQLADHLYENYQDFSKKHDSFWLIINASSFDNPDFNQQLDSIKSSRYIVTDQIKTQNFTAQKYQKLSKST